MNSKKTIGLIIAVAIPLLVGFGGSFFTQTSVGSWYQTLEKPFFNPPNAAFPIAWTILYIMMGLASWFVWKSDVSSSIKKKALLFYGIQLFLNFWWSFLFFTLENPGLALVEIVILLGFILYTTKLFFQLSNPAGWLMIPYIGWVSFATLLNGSIWWLN